MSTTPCNFIREASLSYLQVSQLQTKLEQNKFSKITECSQELKALKNKLSDLSQRVISSSTALSPNEQQFVGGTLQNSESLIETLSKKIDKYKHRAEFSPLSTLPSEIIQLIILFSDHPWLFFLVNKELALIAQDDQTASLFLEQLCARWKIPKPMLIAYLERMFSPEFVKKNSLNLKFLRTQQTTYAKYFKFFSAKKGLLGLQAEIEKKLKTTKLATHVIRGIRQNDPFIIFSILSVLDQIPIENLRALPKEIILDNELHLYAEERNPLTLRVVQKLWNLLNKSLTDKTLKPQARQDASTILLFFVKTFLAHNRFPLAEKIANGIMDTHVKSRAMQEISFDSNMRQTKQNFSRTKKQQSQQKRKTLKQKSDPLQNVDSPAKSIDSFTADTHVNAALAENNVEKAKKIAQRITQETARFFAFEKIAVTLVRQGQYDQAMDLIDKNITSMGATLLALEKISIALAQQGEIKEALKLAKEIRKDSPDYYFKALKGISRALAHSDRFDDAFKIADRIPDKFERSLTLWHLSIILTRKSLFDRAIATIMAIPDSQAASYALQEMSTCLAAEAGEFDLAIKIRNQTLFSGSYGLPLPKNTGST